MHFTLGEPNRSVMLDGETFWEFEIIMNGQGTHRLVWATNEAEAGQRFLEIFDEGLVKRALGND